MKQVGRVDELRVARAQLDGAVAFVPTMGALHSGHAQLIEHARRVADAVVVSCYVNPLQFGPNEDLDRYPRTPDEDAHVAARAGADVLWRPEDGDIYPLGCGAAVRIDVGRIGEVLEGAARPGHFTGVASVVVRLLAAVEPDVLVLGRKDTQQLVVLERVVRDLLMNVRVVGVPTVREPDGLARSSRNAYLSVDERRIARCMPDSLRRARELVDDGERDAARIVAGVRAVLESAGAVPDRIDLVDAGTLEPVESIADSALVLIAARVGSTRLIDNLRLVPRDDEATL